jgi:hypothetical protein
VYHLRDNPEVGAELMAVLDARTDGLAARAHVAGRPERREAHAADALAEVVREAVLGSGNSGGGPSREDGARRWHAAKVPVRVDLPALLRDHPAGHRPTAAQRTALEWLYPRCANEGCGALSRLEFDHRRDWAETHLTLVDLMDRLCDHDHRLKTREGWALVAGRGRRTFVPRDDPRHPRHRADAERSPPAA